MKQIKPTSNFVVNLTTQPLHPSHDIFAQPQGAQTERHLPKTTLQVPAPSRNYPVKRLLNDRRSGAQAHPDIQFNNRRSLFFQKKRSNLAAAESLKSTDPTYCSQSANILIVPNS